MELGEPDIITPCGRLGAGLWIWYADISPVAAAMGKEKHEEVVMYVCEMETESKREWK